MHLRRTLAMAAMLVLTSECKSVDSAAPDVITGTYTLITENGQPVPSDPDGPDGCCLTLGGSISFTGGDSYDLRTTHRNKNTQAAFENMEKGTFVRSENKLTFTRVSGGGVNVPYQLAPGVIDGNTITLLYGDEGPGSNQVRGVFVQIR